MAQDFATSYVDILKYDKNDDGTLTVYGKATSDDLDIDQQICDNDWLKKAMPEWFKSGGNIREQHSSIAAGVATGYEEKGDGYYVTAKVVDKNSILKVEHKVLKGFSIGIKGPRVIRDNKAANGRIVDGQIVELSLVDRPANPTCQLVLAKSVGGESTLSAVEEELIETVETPTKETPVAKSVLAQTIMELSKSATGDSVKFDQASYDTARRALAQLIITEAGEMADGSDERDDIEELIDALKHLFRWADGEDEEGDSNDMSGATIEMSTDAELKKSDCSCDGCKACKADGGCDKTPCEKCADVTTTSAPKSAEADEVTEEAPVAEVVAEEVPVSEETEVAAEEAAVSDILDEKSVSAIVEKAVKTATESVRAEIASLQAVTKAAEEKAVALESELVAAKSAAVAGGPKRTGRIAVTQTNELMLKAAEYRSKAAATSDPILIKGYKALEKEFLSKANKSDDQD